LFLFTVWRWSAAVVGGELWKGPRKREKERERGKGHLERVVAVAGDALVDGEEEEVEPVVVPRVEGRQHVGQHGGV
jgi:hypothetical protein